MNYLDLVRLGKNEWWRYCLAIFVMLVAWQLIGAIPSIILITWMTLDGDPTTQVTSDGKFLGVNINLSFTVLMLASITFLVGIFIAIRFIHQRKLLTLITPFSRINWIRLSKGFSFWFILAALIGLLESSLYPGRYIYSFDGKQFLPFLFLALFFIPIQTSTEELFFRGYLLQGLGLRIRNSMALSIISGIIFMLPHLVNPEAEVNFLLMGITYFAIGATLAFITLQSGSLELALGMHAANNLYTALFANAVITVMPTPSLFLVKELDAVYSLVTTILACMAFLLIFSKHLRKVD